MARHKSARPATRHASDVRRVMVLEAAAKLIADEGLLAATMRRIAQEARISLGTLTHHFKSVDELMAEALELASIRFAEALARLTTKGNAVARLHALTSAVMPDNQQAIRQWRLWIQFWSRAVYDPRLAQTHDRRYRAWYATVSKLVQQGIKDGSLKSDLNPADAAKNLVAVMDGVCFQVVLNAGVMTAAKGRRTIKRAIQALKP